MFQGLALREPKYLTWLPEFNFLKDLWVREGRK